MSYVAELKIAFYSNCFLSDTEILKRCLLLNRLKLSVLKEVFNFGFILTFRVRDEKTSAELLEAMTEASDANTTAAATQA